MAALCRGTKIGGLIVVAWHLVAADCGDQELGVVGLVRVRVDESGPVGSRELRELRHLARSIRPMPAGNPQQLSYTCPATAMTPVASARRRWRT